MGKFKIDKNLLPSLEVMPNVHIHKTNRTSAVNAWYEAANEDVISARVLLQNNRFSHSVFFIQQSIECCIKGIFLENSIAEPHNVKDINHYAFKAFRTYHMKVQDDACLAYSDIVSSYIDKGCTFLEKLEICAKIANVLTTDYNSQIDVEGKILSAHYDPKALGLDESTSQIDCHKRFSKIYYFQFLLILFSYLFSHTVEMNARYPVFSENNIIERPSTSFDGRLKINLSLLILLIQHIISEIIENSLNLVFWHKNDKT